MSETTSPQRFYGKYRGTVINNVDPMQLGRLLVTVPDVLGAGVPSSWAEPCVPLAGPTVPPMGVYLVPPIGAGVWIEFERAGLNARSGWAVAGARSPIFRRWRAPATPPIQTS